MMMASILGFFLTVIWFILPFIIFGIKGKVDRILVVAEDLERRTVAMEAALKKLEQENEVPQLQDPPHPLQSTEPSTDH